MKTFRTRAAVAGLALLVSVAAGAQAASLRWASLPSSKAASAPAILPSAPADAWTTILGNLRDAGKYEEDDGNLPAHFGFEDVKGAADAAHSADYVTVYGSVSDDGLFHPGWVGLVSEKWSIDAKGHWSIDQWLFRVKIDGGARDGMHNVLQESKDRRVLAEEEKGIANGGAAEFKALVARWAAYKSAPLPEE
jgi:hypothetical protein